MTQTEEKPIASLISVQLKYLFHEEAFYSAAASPQRMLAVVDQMPFPVISVLFDPPLRSVWGVLPLVPWLHGGKGPELTEKSLCLHHCSQHKLGSLTVYSCLALHFDAFVSLLIT